MEFRTTSILKIYTGEDVFLGDKPQYKAIVLKAMELGLAGCTVTKGIAGFATHKRGMGRAMSTFASGTGNLPIVIEIVDDKEKIAKLLPYLEKYSKHSFITIKDCTYLVTDYLKEKFAQEAK